MCGRYSMALGNEELYDALEARLPQLYEQGRPRRERGQDHRGRYNVAPRQRAAVIRRDPDNGSQAMVEEMQWGLIPHWTKHPPSGALNTINARSEGLLDASSGGMWHALKGYKRCIIPAQGYYEWLKRPSSKVAHFTRLPLSTSSKDKEDNAHPPLLFFAGLYDHVKYLSPVESRWQPSEENEFEPYPTGNPIPLATFTILTTSPSKDIEWLHDRMPCILDTWDDISRWLDLGEGGMKGWEEGKGGTGELLRGRPGLDCFPVPPEVGKIGKDSPTFIQPVSERSDGIKSFFNKQSPAKPKTEAAEGKPSSLAKDEKPDVEARNYKPDVASLPDLKAEPGHTEMPKVEEGIKSELPDHDEEQGLGDDSNAPNPSPGPGSGSKRRSAPKEERGNEQKEQEKELKEDTSTTATKRKREEKGGAGHRTKVVRKNSSDEAGNAQPAITSFFKSPQPKSNPSKADTETGSTSGPATRKSKRK